MDEGLRLLGPGRLAGHPDFDNVALGILDQIFEVHHIPGVTKTHGLIGTEAAVALVSFVLRKAAFISR